MSLGDITVLHIEEDTEARERLAAVLRPLVRELWLASDGATGLALFDEHHPTMVITSVRLSGEPSGLDVCRAMLERDENIYIVGTVDPDDTANLMAAVQTGIAHFVAKPLDGSSVQHILRHSPLQLVLANVVERQKELTRTILDSQENMVFVTDGEEVIEANRSFFEFFGAADFGSLNKAEFRLGDHLIEREGYVYNRPGSRWLDHILNFPRRRHKVVIAQATSGAERVFLVKVRDFPASRTLYVVTLTDMTEVEEEGKRFELLATIDPLTSIYNRVKFNDSLMQEFSRFERYGGHFSLLMFDIDHFKNINDTYGHHTGDEVLVALARIVDDNIRASDIFARWGGEEFVILTPGTELSGAERLAGHLREAIESHQFPQAGQVTCSFGVTAFQTPDDVDDLMKRADAALYQAKRTGRNRVCVG